MYHTGDRFVKLLGLRLSRDPQFLVPRGFKTAHSLTPNTARYPDWFNRGAGQSAFSIFTRMITCRVLPFLLSAWPTHPPECECPSVKKEGLTSVKLTDLWSCVPRKKGFESDWEQAHLETHCGKMRVRRCCSPHLPPTHTPSGSSQVWPDGRLQPLSDWEQHCSEPGCLLLLFSQV